MDPERKVRLELIRLLGDGFACFEEVWLRVPSGERVSCDVLAVPRDEGFGPLAFECKRPSHVWHYAPWAKAIKQASDYVGAEIADPRVTGVVSAAFLFPAPMAVPNPEGMPESEWVRPGYELAVAGMFHLALFFRVGRAGRGSLALGPNEVWNERSGFTRNGRNLLQEGRPVGSRNIRRPYSPSGYPGQRGHREAGGCQPK